MDPIAKRPALVCNRASGSYDADMAARIEEICRGAGVPLVKTFEIPDDDLPDAEALAAHGIDLLLVWTGDGTINAAATTAARWDGTMLPLPGGTLNLVSKALHGDRSADEILRDALSGEARRTRPPIIHCDAGDAYITVVAGPTTRWAEVRETMRRDGLIDASQAVPDAVEHSLNAPGVRIAGQGKDYQAIILTPTRDGIRADGVVTSTATNLIRHGLAWLGGDFRDGPSEEIAVGHVITIESDAPIGLGIDGESGEVAAPAMFTSAISPIDIIATASDEQTSSEDKASAAA